MKKYIMSKEEFNALDLYLSIGKYYDAGFRIIQSDNNDLGYHEEDGDVMSLKTLIRETFVEGCYEDLIGIHGFSQEHVQILCTLYNKLEDVDLQKLSKKATV